MAGCGAEGSGGPGVPGARPAHPASPRRPRGARPMARSATAPPLPRLARSLPATTPARTTPPGGPARRARQPMRRGNPGWAGPAAANRVRAAAAAEAALGSGGDAGRPGLRDRRTAPPRPQVLPRPAHGIAPICGPRVAPRKGCGRRGRLCCFRARRRQGGRGSQPSGWRKHCGGGMAQGRQPGRAGQGRAARRGPGRRGRGAAGHIRALRAIAAGRGAHGGR